MTQSVGDVMDRIRAEAAAQQDDLLFVRTCCVGDEIRQGDVYLYPRAGRPEGALSPRTSLQLAEGESAGSRHVVVGDAVAYDPPWRRDPLQGPYLEARERVVLTHPEHAHISMPSGWYEVRYQQDFTGVPHVPDGQPSYRARRVVD